MGYAPGLRGEYSNYSVCSKLPVLGNLRFSWLLSLRTSAREAYTSQTGSIWVSSWSPPRSGTTDKICGAASEVSVGRIELRQIKRSFSREFSTEPGAVLYRLRLLINGCGSYVPQLLNREIPQQAPQNNPSFRRTWCPSICGERERRNRHQDNELYSNHTYVCPSKSRRAPLHHRPSVTTPFTPFDVFYSTSFGVPIAEKPSKNRCLR